MKIALLGYGKMGRAIEKIALLRGHTIVIKASQNDTYDITKADVAIDFSVPDSAFNNIVHCFKNNVPIISGTTGWLTDFDKATELCKEYDGAFIYASNFSVGVNVFFDLNKKLARLMTTLQDYKVSLKEIHHTQKLDVPSGTAISLADQIITENPYYNSWQLGDEDSKEVIPIRADRMEGVTGTHEVYYKSIIDTISIKHEAHNREGFALGAMLAAEWILNKTGVFTMQDVLNIG
jgi:4-hydroxy-tetrahydrodipicolinate reductase